MSLLLERFYRFGSVVLRLSAPAFTEQERLKQFVCSPQPPDLTLRINPAGTLRLPAGLPRYRQDADWYKTEQGDIAVVKTDEGMPIWMAEYRNDGSAAAEFNTNAGIPLTTFVVTEILNLPRLLLSKGAVLLHASFIAADGKAILFTGKKQVGKSTQAALWERYTGAKVVNGDRAMLERRGSLYYACGVPYSGTSKICRNADYPIRAVVILSRGERNVVRPATAGEAVRSLLEGCTVDSADEALMSRFLGIAEDIAVSVPFFVLRCLPDESAVVCLKNALTLT